jgi:excisionase family DNA binding protein
LGAADLKQETYLPGADRGELARFYNFLSARDAAGKGQVASCCMLTDPDLGDRVEIPTEVYRVLRQVTEAMNLGLAITIVPQSQTLTTQQAAELLGVSRPTLIRLLETERIPYERIGTHRRVLLRDVLAYREQRREDQYRALEATSVGIEGEEDIETVLASLREVRRQAAEQRRSR